MTDVETRIVILQQGFVVVGRLESETPRGTVLCPAAIVRKFGTSFGLGELAAKGPLPETVLDPCPFGFRYHPLAAVGEFPCNEEAWSDTAWSVQW